ncbi:M24 family metallopeptidase [Natrialba asiatica]|uniref:Peptidase M24 n=1 Tax=Natrialba asiatica (strain ATCC 700177 / DSM 12278 / JCM 9576 / FERM P-10747 / NBRC 102637 / 172P1) TaxID=29540 RepID=M0AZF1_NATA1|nr:M24 family metallopeptidase [Natrialba asiatica]ELZ04006.1 peptidase M24 [Natrialba asiatica DSM 12278]
MTVDEFDPNDGGGALLSDAVERREAAAFVHVGPLREPASRYCVAHSGVGVDAGPEFVSNSKPQSRPRLQSPSAPAPSTLVAVAFVRPAESRSAVESTGRWLVRTRAPTDDSSPHPASELATTLAERLGSATVLTPPSIPHDAALYLENAGLALASTTVLERARAKKTPSERQEIAAAQAAASAGIRRAATLLAAATVRGGELVDDDSPLTAERLRTAVDEAIVAAGAFPAGNTVVTLERGHASTTATDGETAFTPDDLIVIEAAPRSPSGHHGGLVRTFVVDSDGGRERRAHVGVCLLYTSLMARGRTFVVDSDGGRERRAHVGVTQSFRSARAMLTAATETVGAVEADLEAEVRAFGFEEADAVTTSVSGVGLEPTEFPRAVGDDIEPGHVVRLESAVRVADEAWLRIADLLAVGEVSERDGDAGEHSESTPTDWLSAPSRSLDPNAVREPNS